MRRLGSPPEGAAHVRADEIPDQQEGNHDDDAVDSDRAGFESLDDDPSNLPDTLQHQHGNARGPGPALKPEGANAEGEVKDAKDRILDRRVGEGPSAVLDRRSRHMGD